MTSALSGMQACPAAEMELGPSGEFMIKSGSKARLRTTTTIPRGTTILRNTLIDKGVLRQDGNFLLFASDYNFSSAAAATVIGASANGRILWKMPDGRTCGDWEAGQGDLANLPSALGNVDGEPTPS